MSPPPSSGHVSDSPPTIYPGTLDLSESRLKAWTNLQKSRPTITQSFAGENRYVAKCTSKVPHKVTVRFPSALLATPWIASHLVPDEDDPDTFSMALDAKTTLTTNVTFDSEVDPKEFQSVKIRDLQKAETCTDLGAWLKESGISVSTHANLPNQAEAVSVRFGPQNIAPIDLHISKDGGTSELVTATAATVSGETEITNVPFLKSGNTVVGKGQYEVHIPPRESIQQVHTLPLERNSVPSEGIKRHNWDDVLPSFSVRLNDTRTATIIELPRNGSKEKIFADAHTVLQGKAPFKSRLSYSRVELLDVNKALTSGKGCLKYDGTIGWGYWPHWDPKEGTHLIIDSKALKPGDTDISVPASCHDFRLKPVTVRGQIGVGKSHDYESCFQGTPKFVLSNFRVQGAEGRQGSATMQMRDVKSRLLPASDAQLKNDDLTLLQPEDRWQVDVTLKVPHTTTVCVNHPASKGKGRLSDAMTYDCDAETEIRLEGAFTRDDFKPLFNKVYFQDVREAAERDPGVKRWINDSTISFNLENTALNADTGDAVITHLPQRDLDGVQLKCYSGDDCTGEFKSGAEKGACRATIQGRTTIKGGLPDWFVSRAESAPGPPG